MTFRLNRVHCLVYSISGEETCSFIEVHLWQSSLARRMCVGDTRASVTKMVKKVEELLPSPRCHKRKSNAPRISVGDVVIIHDDQPRAMWNLEL